MSLVAKFYSSADPGAPELTGQAGALTAVLDAVLVDGYASGSEAKASLGWTREFTATNKRVFRGNPVSGTGRYIRVDDSAAIGNARSAWVRGFETMSDIDTGTGPFPTPDQLVDGSVFVKSGSLSSAARAWRVVGNERSVYLFISATSNTQEYGSPNFFGDLLSLNSADTNHCAVSTIGVSTYSGSLSEVQLFKHHAPSQPITPDLAGMYIARSYTGGLGAVPAYSVGGPLSAGYFGGTNSSDNPLIYPYPVNDGLLYFRPIINETALRPRALLPGLFVPQHGLPFSDQQLVGDVQGVADGTMLKAITTSTYAGYQDASLRGQVLFDMTSEW